MAMIKVTTPFGVGFASNEEDLEKMTEWLKPYIREYEGYQKLAKVVLGVEPIDAEIDEHDCVRSAAIGSVLRGLMAEEKKPRRKTSSKKSKRLTE